MKIISLSPAHTIRIGSLLASHLRRGSIVCLFGELGSGKTMLTKGIAKGVGIDPTGIISPTFVLVRQYQGKVPLYHFDLYRMEKVKDIADLGYEEFFYGDGITVIEWADRLKGILPEEYLKIELLVVSEKIRQLCLQGIGKEYQGCITKLNENSRY